MATNDLSNSMLVINNKDALTQWGVTMGDKFLSALFSSAPMKEYISNNSRLEHGRRYVTNNTKVDERDLTLQFRIKADTQVLYETNKNAFLSELETGNVDIKVPQRSSKVFHLIYTGNGITYSENIQGTFGLFSCKFKEPNPKSDQQTT